MKTKILLASLFFIAPFNAFASMSFSPASPISIPLSVLITTDTSFWNSYSTTVTCSSGDTVMTFFPDGTPDVFITPCNSSPFTVDFLLEDPTGTYNGVSGTYTYIECNSLLDSACGGTGFATISDAQASLSYISTATFTWNVSSGGGSSDSAFMTQLANATSTFQSTTGFDIAGVVAWSGDNLIKLFIGSGLAVLLALRGWIVALVVIGSIVYFAYRAFRFFRH